MGKWNKYLRVDLLRQENINAIIVCGHKGTGGQKGIIVGAIGVVPSITATCWKDPQMVAWINEKDIQNH